MSNLSLESGTWILGADSGGGTNLNSVALETVDLTDGTWTLYDVDSMVKSVSHSSGVNTITFNAVAGSSNNQWLNSTCRAPRWYKSLVVNGVSMTEDSFLSKYLKFSAEGTATLQHYSVFGTCSNPTSTSNGTGTSNIQGYGALAGFNPGFFIGGFPVTGVWARNNATWALGTGGEVVHVSMLRGGGGIGSIGGLTYKSGTPAYDDSRDPNQTNLSNNPIYWIVGAGAQGSGAISDGATVILKAEYLAVGVTF